MVVKPIAIGERPVAANKNLRIQNAGRRHEPTAPRRVASAGVYCEEILTGDRWGRRTPYVLDRAAFPHAAAGFGSSPARQSVGFTCRYGIGSPRSRTLDESNQTYSRRISQ